MTAALLMLSPSIANSTELVLREGAALTVQTKNGELMVSAGRGLDRSYTWSGCTLDADMIVRNRRFLGQLGAFDPAAQSSFLSFLERSCHGISRTVVQEAQLHFDDREFLHRWLDRWGRYPDRFAAVWNSFGLFVNWSAGAPGDPLVVDLFQLCLNDEPARNLTGARDENFAITVPKDAGAALFGCAQVPPSVIESTRKEIEAEWATTDRYIADRRRLCEKFRQDAREREQISLQNPNTGEAETKGSRDKAVRSVEEWCDR